MDFSDRLFGTISVTDPLALELIAADELQRLQGIDQAGYFDVHFPGARHTRFEHSLGVYELLRRHKAAREEQIAGLLHDVSHSAFSHTIDYIMHDGSGAYQTYQDEILDEYIRHSTLAPILQRHGMTIESVTNDENFPLKERDLPDLCADRIDYSLRGMLVFHVAHRAEVERLRDALRTTDGAWYFPDRLSAEQFARYFRELNERFYSAGPTAHMFYTTSEYIKHALQRGYISREDLYTTDAAVLEAISAHHSQDERLQQLFERMNNTVTWQVHESIGEGPIYTKSRAVDPLFEERGELRRLSAVDPAWQAYLAEGLQPKRYFLQFQDIPS